MTASPRTACTPIRASKATTRIRAAARCSRPPMQRDRAMTIYEKSKPGRRAFVAPELDVPEPRRCSPSSFRRAEPPKLPEIAEPEIVRHYNRLSKRNFDLDTGFYPLGSCTMKHNPKLHERVAALPGNARLHPLQDPKRAQGALQLMYELQQRARRDRRPAARRRSSRAPARTASSPACCSPAPTTRTAASTARRSSRPTPRTAPTRRR